MLFFLWNLSHLFRIFRPFAFNVIIDMVRFEPITLLFVSFVFCFVLFLLPSALNFLVIWFYNLNSWIFSYNSLLGCFSGWVSICNMCLTSQTTFKWYYMTACIILEDYNIRLHIFPPGLCAIVILLLLAIIFTLNSQLPFKKI